MLRGKSWWEDRLKIDGNELREEVLEETRGNGLEEGACLERQKARMDGDNFTTHLCHLLHT